MDNNVNVCLSKIWTTLVRFRISNKTDIGRIFVKTQHSKVHNKQTAYTEIRGHQKVGHVAEYLNQSLVRRDTVYIR